MRYNMIEPGKPSIISDGLIRRLRDAAQRPTSVRELTALILADLNCNVDAVIPVLAGFVYAFHLPLRNALPIREWLGTDNDAEIDALILPEIEATRHKWEAEDTFISGESNGGLPVGDTAQPALK